ncbi:MAG: cytochrome c oxidase subunit 3 [Pyrinomonadaceae bacterium]
MRTVAVNIDARREPSPPVGYRRGVVGMWVALSGILMLFTALTSAYIVRAGLSDDWRPLMMPRVLWLSTALILASSASFEVARRCLKRGSEQAYRYWLLATVVLGVSFLGSQLLAWRQMVAGGIYIATNPHSSFFYALTGTHGLHLLAGILALDYLLLRAWRPRPLSRSAALTKRQTAADVVAIYWHFMGGLWVYLFLLLFVWR